MMRNGARIAILAATIGTALLGGPRFLQSEERCNANLSAPAHPHNNFGGGGTTSLPDLSVADCRRLAGMSKGGGTFQVTGGPSVDVAPDTVTTIAAPGAAPAVPAQPGGIATPTCSLFAVTDDPMASTHLPAITRPQNESATDPHSTVGASLLGAGANTVGGTTPLGNGTALPGTAVAPGTAGAPGVTVGSAADGGSSSGPPLQLSNPVDSSVPGGQALQTMSNAAAISDDARGIELVQAASAARESVSRAATQDQAAVNEPYRNASLETFGERLNRAKGNLEGLASSLENSSSTSLEPAERARFRNVALNAAGKADAALEAVGNAQAREQALGDNSPFGSLFAQAQSTDDKAKALGQAFGVLPPPRGLASAATTNEGLVNRLVLLNGLPEAERNALFKNLSLGETVTVKLPDGSKKNFDIVHNGYILGGKGSAIDCSSFVSSLLPADSRKSRFTTLDFRTMWVYRHTGEFPVDPRYVLARSKVVREVAEGFTAIDLHLDEEPRIGDLLIYRMDGATDGHIFIVRSYNRDTMSAEVIEAAQSSGTISERRVSLGLYPPGDRRRRFRGGLYVLRLKPVNNKACGYHGKGSVKPTAPKPFKGTKI